MIVLLKELYIVIYYYIIIIYLVTTNIRTMRLINNVNNLFIIAINKLV